MEADGVLCDLDGNVNTVDRCAEGLCVKDSVDRCYQPTEYAAVIADPTGFERTLHMGFDAECVTEGDLKPGDLLSFDLFTASAPLDHIASLKVLGSPLRVGSPVEDPNLCPPYPYHNVEPVPAGWSADRPSKIVMPAGWSGTPPYDFMSNAGWYLHFCSAFGHADELRAGSHALETLAERVLQITPSTGGFADQVSEWHTALTALHQQQLRDAMDGVYTHEDDVLTYRSALNGNDERPLFPPVLGNGETVGKIARRCELTEVGWRTALSTALANGEQPALEAMQAYHCCALIGNQISAEYWEPPSGAMSSYYT